MHLNGLLAALDRDRPHGLSFIPVADPPPHRVRNEDLAGFGFLLQTCRQVDGVPDHPRSAVLEPPTGDDQPGVPPHPHAPRNGGGVGGVAAWRSPERTGRGAPGPAGGGSSCGPAAAPTVAMRASPMNFSTS